MKIALIFDDLIQFGGAERLLLAVHELYPDAPIYTSLASDEWIKRCEDRKVDLRTSFMQKLPFKEQLNRFYGLLGVHTLAFESFKFDSFDVVLSISARFAHGVLTKPRTTHVCYMNSPGRMFWEPRDYFEREGFLQNDILRPMFWFFVMPLLSLLRLWDYSAVQRVDYLIANSKTPENRIKKYLQRNSRIIYPFVSIERGGQTQIPVREDPPTLPYYLIITRLQSWKRVDLAIEACKKLNLRLKIIGAGADKVRLKKLSNKNIEFLGYVSEEEKYRMLEGCQALIVTQKEDFGITALEAMLVGRPVIAYGAGGALETVVKNVTGEFFEVQDAESLAAVLSTFDPLHYKPQDCRARATKFSKQKFVRELDEFIKNVYHKQNSL